jgi:hypothetical protein
MDLRPDVSSHLDRFKEGLQKIVDLRGLYLYGSLTTGDFSPATSDIDTVAVPEQRPGPATLEKLRSLHLSLARAGGAFARLNCLYAPAGTLANAAQLHSYWYGDRFTEWRLKVMTMAELTHSGRALHGQWPPPGLREVSLAELRAHVRDDLDDYWRRMAARRGIWLQDRWVDFGLVTLPRAAAVLRDGDLITKSAAIGRLPDFGVPDWLAEQIKRRRAGEDVHLTAVQRLTRADLARQIMAGGVRTLTAHQPLG